MVGRARPGHAGRRPRASSRSYAARRQEAGSRSRRLGPRPRVRRARRRSGRHRSCGRAARRGRPHAWPGWPAWPASSTNSAGARPSRAIDFISWPPVLISWPPVLTRPQVRGSRPDYLRSGKHVQVRQRTDASADRILRQPDARSPAEDDHVTQTAAQRLQAVDRGAVREQQQVGRPVGLELRGQAPAGTGRTARGPARGASRGAPAPAAPRTRSGCRARAPSRRRWSPASRAVRESAPCHGGCAAPDPPRGDTLSR